MACIRESPNPFFRLGPAAQSKPQCFAVQRGDVRGHGFGASLYAPELELFKKRLASHRFATGPLSQYAILNPPAKLGDLEPDSFVSFLPMEAVEDGATGGFSLTDRQLSEVNKGYTPFAEGDILWAKITPCMQNGKSCIAQGLSNGVGFGSTEFHVIRVKDPAVSPRFLWEFLNQETLRKVAQYTFTGSAGQQRVPQSFLEGLPFPLLPIHIQESLVKAMDQARAERQAKLAKANAFRDGLDEFLLTTLNLSLPPKDNRNTYAVRGGDIERRFDAYSNQPRFRELFTRIQGSHYRVETFSKLANCIFSGITPLAKGDAYTSPPDGVRFIRSGEITDDGEVTSTSEVHINESIHNGMMKRSQLKRGDLLIAIVGATIGATGVFNRDEEANINQAIAVVRLDSDEVSAEFACLYLRSSLGQMLLDYFKRPVARANINLEEIGVIPIIIPPQPVQNTIVQESHRRREEARRLRAEAEAGWQAAKQWFEAQLLGDAPI